MWTPFSKMRAPITKRTSTPFRYGPGLSDLHSISHGSPRDHSVFLGLKNIPKSTKNEYVRTNCDIFENRTVIKKSWREVLDISIYYRMRIDFLSPLSPCGRVDRSNSIHEFSVFEFVRTNRFRRNVGVDGRIFLFMST